MSIIRKINTAVGSTFQNQWKDIITIDSFDNYTTVKPGLLRSKTGDICEITSVANGSRVFVPENTCALIIKNGKIENVAFDSGTYEILDGEKTIFNGDGIVQSLIKPVTKKIGFGGQEINGITVAFVNLKDIKNLKFGSFDPVLFNDRFYGIDLEMIFRGNYSIKIIDPVKFVTSFLPPEKYTHSFESVQSREMLSSDITQELIYSLSHLSENERISKIATHLDTINSILLSDNNYSKDWNDNYGIKLIDVTIESVSLTSESMKIINSYNETKTKVTAYDGVSNESIDAAAKINISEGIKNNGLGNSVFGTLSSADFVAEIMTNKNRADDKEINNHIETLVKLKELLDSGVITQEEFEKEKKKLLK